MPHNTIELDVLRVASPDVLGQTKKLSVADPFRFSNAKGDLKDVSGFEEIRNVAAASALNFKSAMNASK